jgi:thymidylate synthase
MLQEMMACRLGIEVGEYYQYVGSMHVYTANLADLRTYIDEGHHRVAEMPPMSAGDPFGHVDVVLNCERRMREGEYFDASAVVSDPYWGDLVRLLQAFWASGMGDRLDDLLSKFEHPMYRAYAETRRHMRRRFASDR